jgi:SAM-dependent methyltransferase
MPTPLLSKRLSHRSLSLLTLLLPMALLPGYAAAQAVPADAPAQIGQVSKDSVWVPTPERMIRRMLQTADTTKDDVVMDLGSGDGRVPIHAAKHFGARAIGVELEANLIRISEESAKREGVSQRVTFLKQDLFDADLSEVTVFALYISPGVMDRLRPKLLALKPGTRVTSHHFTLGDWEPDESFRIENRAGYLWVVPADVRGQWKVALAGNELTLDIAQKHQMLTTTGARTGQAVNVIGARLRGTEVSFTAFDRDGHSRYFTGVVNGNRMSGESTSENGKPLRWSATRNER